MKNYLFIIFISILFSCDESEEVANQTECNATLTLMNRAADKFSALTDNGTATKADCNDLVEKMSEYLPCMAEGQNKIEFELAIAEFADLCKDLPT
jgi:hypothetical protein